MKKRFLLSSAISHSFIVASCATLAACGGGLSNGPGQSSTPAPQVNESQFASVSAYCTTDTLKPSGPTYDGWVALPNVTSTPEHNTTSAIASTNGHTSTIDPPITMNVPHDDYRGIKSTAVMSGFGKPEWVMGVSLPTLLAAHATACVTQVARIMRPTDPFANTPFASLLKPVDTTPVLYWRSFWNKEVPVTQLSGYLIDGFEFVSDFQPSDGQVYFVLDKSRFTSPQTTSLCYLAPAAVQWDCRQPNVADQGSNWQVYQQGLKQGVYVLTSPTFR
jgi:hypothetical protein